MRGVFYLLAFTHVRYECKDVLSLCDGMHLGAGIAQSVVCWARCPA